MSSTSSVHLNGSVKGMAHRMLDFPPQILEIDPGCSTSLQSPSASAAWDSSGFTAPEFGDNPTYGPLETTKQVQGDSQNRVTVQNPLLHWYVGNDGPWVPRSSISEVPGERLARGLEDDQLSFAHGDPYGQRIPSELESYPFGVPPSDSGYGTRRSDGDASVFSMDVPDKDQDGQDFTGRAADFQPYPAIDEGFQQQERHISDWNLLPDVTLPESKLGKTFVCTRCQKQVKTRSELKYEYSMLY